MPTTPQRHVVCLGDSLTRGQVSADYVEMLASRHNGTATFTNAGVNGDLAFNVLQRLDSIIDLRPDVVSVLIGTNDANASLSEKNVRMMTRMKQLPPDRRSSGIATISRRSSIASPRKPQHGSAFCRFQSSVKNSARRRCNGRRNAAPWSRRSPMPAM